MGDERREQQDDHRHRHAERPALAEPHDFGRQAINRYAVAEDERDPARDAQHAERHDERRNVALGDEEAVDGAGRRPGRKAAENPHPPGKIEIGRDHRAHDPGKSEHGADRKIDAGRRNDERHPDRQHAEHRGREKNVENVGDGQEGARQECHRRAQHGEHDQRFEPDGAAAAEARPPRRRRGGARARSHGSLLEYAAPSAKRARRPAPARIT